MYYKLTLALKAIFICLIIKAQSISPLESTEECPNINITFNVNIPGKVNSPFVTPVAVNVPPLVTANAYNIKSSGASTTFSFQGKFLDYNNKQTFRVNYYDSNYSLQYHDFTYKRIKSLLTENPFSVIYPNQTKIVFPRCQIKTDTISFDNVQYGNPYETPPIAYGAVINYEYLLPSDWKLGQTVSDGKTWIASKNKVSITSDLSTGDSGVIRIRPVNTACGLGLKPGREATISISRPEPILSITANDNTNYLCSGSKSYTINGLPQGAIVVWSLTNPAVATIPPNSTGPSVVVTKAADAGVATLKAIVTHCSYTYTKTFDILSGPPQSIVINNFTNAIYCGEYNSFNVLPSNGNYYPYQASFRFVDATGVATFYSWKAPYGNGSSPMNWQGSADGNLDMFSKFSNSSILLRCTGSNACGSTSKDYYFSTSGCIVAKANYESNLNESLNKSLSIFPNPAKDILNIFFPNDLNMENTCVKILDMQGIEISTIKINSYNKVIPIYGLSSGIYLFKIYNNKKLITTKKVFKY